MTDQFKFVEFLAVENGFIIFAGREAGKLGRTKLFDFKYFLAKLVNLFRHQIHAVFRALIFYHKIE